MTVTCVGCHENARFAVYACYPIEVKAWHPHPRLARYPMPLARVCASCLPTFLWGEKDLPASTRGWLVTPIPGGNIP